MIVDELLNVAALLLLRLCRPVTAHAVLMHLGRPLPSRRSLDEARKKVAGLSARGTCLSRALAVAARTPSADVVIGIRGNGNAGFRAHAWLEVEGWSLDSLAHEQYEEITRLRGPGGPSRREQCQGGGHLNVLRPCPGSGPAPGRPT
ncbi:MAG: lasso peptide biosynthesis protein [Polyangiaceae bacterium]